jgi:arabinogalactan oligomer/maltooligosaccharide transport system permease protein
MIMGMFPGFMTMIALYYILKMMGLDQTMGGLILCYSAGSGLGYLVMKGYLDTIPHALDEAATIDGASDMQVMVKIALPLVKYTFLSIFLILFIEYWNDYLIPNFYLPNHKTLSLALYQQSQGQEISNTQLQYVPYVMSTVLLVTIPVVVLFAVFSKRLMGNLSVGGLKG